MKSSTSQFGKQLILDFSNPEEVKEAIKRYRHLDHSVDGINQNGEQQHISFSESGAVLTTYQANGFVRINYFDENGQLEGEAFDGRWKMIDEGIETRASTSPLCTRPIPFIDPYRERGV